MPQATDQIKETFPNLKVNSALMLKWGGAVGETNTWLEVGKIDTVPKFEYRTKTKLGYKLNAQVVNKVVYVHATSTLEDKLFTEFTIILSDQFKFEVYRKLVESIDPLYIGSYSSYAAARKKCIC